MSEVAMNQKNTMKADELLSLLGIFHIIWGIMLGGVMLVVVARLLSMIGRHHFVANGEQLVLLAILSTGLTVLNIMASRFINMHRGYTFIVVVSCINCFILPLGLLLGVFSLFKLTTTEVKDKFIS
ncbi:hypothetical protein AAEX28_10480 [Lentisphaerota bacterium WC36G]|nr:hypothetical protein LJT99_13325 [Lentisphaerae bacterium WC36]